MIKYKTETEEKQIPVGVVCDICKKEYGYSGNECFEAQEFQHIRVHGGYGSVFGDGSVLKADICQHCFQKIFGKYLIEV